MHPAGLGFLVVGGAATFWLMRRRRSGLRPAPAR